MGRPKDEERGHKPGGDLGTACPSEDPVSLCIAAVWAVAVPQARGHLLSCHGLSSQGHDPSCRGKFLADLCELGEIHWEQRTPMLACHPHGHLVAGTPAAPITSGVAGLQAMLLK